MGYGFGYVLQQPGDNSLIVHITTTLGQIPRKGSVLGHVTATTSRRNSMESVGGYHIVLATEPSLTWADARARGIFVSDLIGAFLGSEKEVLTALLSQNLTDASINNLACAVSGNSEFTANRPDIHAHVQVAPIATWKSGAVRLMVDDARSPSIIAKEAVKEERMREAAHELVASKRTSGMSEG